MLSQGYTRRLARVTHFRIIRESMDGEKVLCLWCPSQGIVKLQLIMARRVFEKNYLFNDLIYKNTGLSKGNQEGGGGYKEEISLYNRLALSYRKDRNP
jgi:hypothetical protein